MKSKSHVRLRTKCFKSVGNESIWHVNKTIGHINEAIQYKELETINVITTCTDKEK